MPEQIAKNIYWNGIKDWALRYFHGRELSTRHGSTYNSYLITDEKTILVDTVYYPFTDAFIKNLEAFPGLSNIDAVVINHIEPDHGGALGRLMDGGLRPGIPIYCSKPGVDIIKKYFQKDGWNFQPVATGDTLKTGEYELMFVEMRMIHWPDSMMTYVRGANTLLSNDAFGQHMCTSGFYDGDADESELFGEALKYYAGILSPFSKLIERSIEEALALKLPIDVIAPSHGVIWRKDPVRIIDKYLEWSRDYTDGSVVIVYDCLYEATAAIAGAIARGLGNKGVKHKIVNIADADVSDLIADLFCAKGMIVGSSTINNTMFRTIAGLLDSVRTHKLKNKVGAAFGSYGWSGEAPKMIAEALARAGIDVIGDPIRIRFAPDAGELAECVAFGERFADAL